MSPADLPPISMAKQRFAKLGHLTTTQAGSGPGSSGSTDPGGPQVRVGSKQNAGV